MELTSPRAARFTLPDLGGGIAAGLVAMPSAIAFGLLITSAIGPGADGQGPLLGMLGAFTIGIVAAIFGGTVGTVSAPCAPAAAVLAAFAAELSPHHSAVEALTLVTLTGAMAGALQILFSFLRAGKIIKFVPFSVVAGYSCGVAILILLAQVPKLFGVAALGAVFEPSHWQSASLVVAIATIAAMIAAPHISKKLPAPILALLAGLVMYLTVGQHLGHVTGSPSLVVGAVSVRVDSWLASFAPRVSALRGLNVGDLRNVFAHALTLAVLLSIDTLKTCVVVDATTGTRHDSNRELLGQGLANLTAATFGGMAGSAGSGPTFVNLNSGGRHRSAGVVAGVFALLALLFLTPYFAWLPLAALAGILSVIAVRMIDVKTFDLLRKRQTRFDFLVVFTVTVVAVAIDLLSAAGLGVLLSIILFMREQMRGSVILRRRLGSECASQTRRLPQEEAVLEHEGQQTLVLELQGDLFFGTSDQLFKVLEPELALRKYIILGLRQVQSLDFSAAHTLEIAAQRLHGRGGTLIFADVPEGQHARQDIAAYLTQLRLAERGGARLMPALDDALEWAENEILRAHAPVTTETRCVPLTRLHFFAGTSPELLAKLAECAVEKRYAAGDFIFRHGDKTDSLFLLGQGLVRIQVTLDNHQVLRIATFSTGHVFGEMAFIDGNTRSADAVAATEIVVYEISRKTLQAQGQSALGELIFSRLAHVLSSRLRAADRALRSLQD